MAPDIALDAIPARGGDEALLVLDPMCGSGTVLAAAVERGHRAFGVDIDPLAVMMSRLTVSRVNTKRVTAAAESVLEAAPRRKGSAPWGNDSETEKFVDYWFGSDQKQQLMALTSAIASVGNKNLELALRLAVSRIIITKSSQASLAQDTSHSRPHRVRTESDYDVFEGFDRSVKQLCKMLDSRELNGTGSVRLGDARRLAGIKDGSVDLVVTSPPYLNALDYMRGHKLALVWFGHKISDLRDRRSSSIGAERGLGIEASPAVVAILRVIEASVTDPERLPRPMLERFAHDCTAFAVKLGAKTKPGGQAVLVVGNSTLKDNYIRNDLIAREAMERAGFTFVGSRERDIPQNSRYMPISAKDSGSSVNKRMRKEIVLTMVR
jgi:hypothetical protein